MLAEAAASGPGLAQDVLLPVLAYAYWRPYNRRARLLAANGRPVGRWREWMFGGGVVVLLIALSSPFGSLSGDLLIAHMIEHLLIGDIAALMIVLGLTGPMIAPLLRIRAIGRLRFLVHPLVAAPLWLIDFYAWHLPVLYQAALRHDGIHALQHACFFSFGFAMWMALLGPLPKPAWFGNAARLLYIGAVRLAGAVLGNIFLWSHTVFYPYYVGRDSAYGISAQSDQNVAGAVMMVEGSILTLGLFAWLFLRTAAQSEERQELLDFAQANAYTLDEARATRAVAAGRGAELRVRLEGAAVRRAAHEDDPPASGADGADTGAAPRVGI
ncbi:MAG TPA: cytochrome c oxidase assembly protein [Solirubrobacteraceae bacterium]|jgi:cytochrome c oxidase assembly factor CtaG|nr:cytochrome c oxidase assembly protein [Solirubrobacteraceae bacterium]